MQKSQKIGSRAGRALIEKLKKIVTLAFGGMATFETISLARSHSLQFCVCINLERLPGIS